MVLLSIFALVWSDRLHPGRLAQVFENTNGIFHNHTIAKSEDNRPLFQLRKLRYLDLRCSGVPDEYLEYLNNAVAGKIKIRYIHDEPSLFSW